MASKERIKDIKKRKLVREKTRKHRIYLIRRCVLVLIAIGLIIWAIFSIKGCVSRVKMERAREAAILAASEALKPTPTPPPRYNDYGIDETFYNNTVFLGNSFIEGMTVYDLVENADYFSKIGLTVSQVMTEATDMGNIPVIEELNTGKKYYKVFLMFGENEVGWIGDSFFRQYKEVIKKVKEYQPQAEIYLLAITAISKKVSEEDVDNLNVNTVKYYNSKIKELADETNTIFADLFSATAGVDDFLPDGAATDGIHFGEDYYIKCLKLIQDINRETPKPVQSQIPSKQQN